MWCPSEHKTSAIIELFLPFNESLTKEMPSVNSQRWNVITIWMGKSKKTHLEEDTKWLRGKQIQEWYRYMYMWDLLYPPPRWSDYPWKKSISMTYKWKVELYSTSKHCIRPLWTTMVHQKIIEASTKLYSEWTLTKMF